MSMSSYLVSRLFPMSLTLEGSLRSSWTVLVNFSSVWMDNLVALASGIVGSGWGGGGGLT
jgi:hypothetical protein